MRLARWRITLYRQPSNAGSASALTSLCFLWTVSGILLFIRLAAWTRQRGLSMAVSSQTIAAAMARRTIHRAQLLPNQRGTDNALMVFVVVPAVRHRANV
jgi:hypothetical protein